MYENKINFGCLQGRWWDCALWQTGSLPLSWDKLQPASKPEHDGPGLENERMDDKTEFEKRKSDILFIVLLWSIYSVKNWTVWQIRASGFYSQRGGAKRFDAKLVYAPECRMSHWHFQTILQEKEGWLLRIIVEPDDALHKI